MTLHRRLRLAHCVVGIPLGRSGGGCHSLLERVDLFSQRAQVFVQIGRCLPWNADGGG